MTAAAEHVSTEHAAPIPLPGDMPEPAQVPRLADGIELLGEYQGSGYSQPPSLVRRPDGQVIQISPLLYRVTCRIDGSRNPAAVADQMPEAPSALGVFVDCHASSAFLASLKGISTVNIAPRPSPSL